MAFLTHHTVQVCIADRKSNHICPKEIYTHFVSYSIQDLEQPLSPLPASAPSPTGAERGSLIPLHFVGDWVPTQVIQCSGCKGESQVLLHHWGLIIRGVDGPPGLMPHGVNWIFKVTRWLLGTGNLPHRGKSLISKSECSLVTLCHLSLWWYFYPLRTSSFKHLSNILTY